MTTPLAPAGLPVRPDRTLKRVDGMLVGGAPLRILRLTTEGSKRVESWLGGDPVGPEVPDRTLARRLLDAGLVHPHQPVDPAPKRSTFVVPVRDDAAGLARLLRSLPPGAPVVVVDDGSADRGPPEAEATATGATYVRREVAGGPGAARNRGLEEVETELVVFVDADVVVDRLDLTHLSGHFVDPAVAAVAPRVRSSSTEPGVISAYERRRSPLDLGSAPSPVGPGRRVSYVPAACLAVRVESLREVGGFDAALRWGEDVDLIWRLIELGHRVRYEPAVEVEHRPRADVAGLVRQRRGYGSSAAALAARHGTAVAPVRGSVSSAAAWAAGVTGRPGLAIATAAGSASALAARLAHLPGGARVGAGIGLAGHLHVGLAMSREMGRSWWPLSVAASVVGRRRPAAVAAGFVLPHLIEWLRDPGPPGPLPTVALGIIDDLAYGVGVWEGMWAERSLAALRPRLVWG